MLCTVSCNSKLELNHEVGVQVKGQKTSMKVMLTAFEEFYLHVSIVHKGITLKPWNLGNLKAQAQLEMMRGMIAVNVAGMIEGAMDT